MAQLWFLGIVQQEREYLPKPVEQIFIDCAFEDKRISNFIATSAPSNFESTRIATFKAIRCKNE